jgi:hypothetical protein
MQAILDQNYIADAMIHNTATNFGEKVGVIASLFGCWHPKMGRPITVGRESYCACLECGARKPFDAEKLKVSNSFYYPPIVSPLKRD